MKKLNQFSKFVSEIRNGSYELLHVISNSNEVTEEPVDE